MPAWPPLRRSGGAAVSGGNFPRVVLVEENPTGVESDDLHQRLAGTLEKVGCPDGALQDAQRTRHSFEQGAQLPRMQQGKRVRAERKIAGRAGAARGLVEA